MELLYAIQDELIADPEGGDLVKGLGGVRKARIAAPNRPGGKSGGYRYLYLYFEMRGQIYLLYLLKNVNGRIWTIRCARLWLQS